MDAHLSLLWDGAVFKKELEFAFTFSFLPIFPDLAGLRR